MRKKLFICLFLVITILEVVSQELNVNTRGRFSISWSVEFDGQPEAFSRTSVIGLGVVLYNNNKFDIRNQIEFCNGVIIMEDLDVKYYKKSLIEKISIGILTREGLFRPYGFVKGGIGYCGEELWDFSTNPLMGNVGLGTGLDIFPTDNWSFFMEIEFLGNIYQGDFIPQQGFALGVMRHF